MKADIEHICPRCKQPVDGGRLSHVDGAECIDVLRTVNDALTVELKNERRRVVIKENEIKGLMNKLSTADKANKALRGQTVDLGQKAAELRSYLAATNSEREYWKAQTERLTAELLAAAERALKDGQDIQRRSAIIDDLQSGGRAPKV